jgi:hypothetical protein
VRGDGGGVMCTGVAAHSQRRERKVLESSMWLRKTVGVFLAGAIVGAVWMLCLGRMVTHVALHAARRSSAYVLAGVGVLCLHNAVGCDGGARVWYGASSTRQLCALLLRLFLTVTAACMGFHASHASLLLCVGGMWRVSGGFCKKVLSALCLHAC